MACSAGTESSDGAGNAATSLQHTPSLYLVAFGLPQALEQPPQRAVQAALVLRRPVVEAESKGTGDPCPILRQAIHWGQLLVHAQVSDPTARLLAVGETLALPVQLLGEAAPGKVLISAQMEGLVDGTYELQARDGPIDTMPSARIAAYRVVDPPPRRSPPVHEGTRPLSAFVGRDREMAILSAALAQAENGRGHVVGIVGEPGIGKSRLLHELRRSLGGKPLVYLHGYYVSYSGATPYFPALDLLRHCCGIVDTDGPQAIASNVRRHVHELGLPPDEWAPYLIQLLGGTIGTEQLTMFSPQTVRARTIEALVQLCLYTGQQCPRILAIEDPHWIDATSEDWLLALVERLAGVAILVLTTYRPGYRPPWLDKSMPHSLRCRG